MKMPVIAALIVASGMLLAGSPAQAQDHWGLLTPAQNRAYHACLHAAWVQSYCHDNSRAVTACIAVNGGEYFPPEGRRFTDDYCWHAAQELRTR